MLFPQNTRPNQTSKSGFATVLVLLIVILAVAAVGYLLWQRQQDKLAQDKLQTQVTELSQQVGAFVTPTPMVSPVLTLPPGATPGPDSSQPPAQIGMIEGTLSYPSEILPKQKICAVDTTTSVESCTTTNKGNTYVLAVPPGTYHVYAVVAEDSDAPLKTKAFYSEFVTCGLLATCPSHKPIDVVVATGATIKDINPGDWYNQ